MPPLTTWLIRHGESTANAGLPSVKHADAPLTERGIAESRTLAGKLKKKPDRLIISQSLRTRTSASFITLRWPEIVTEIWPIHEFTYLSPLRCLAMTKKERQPLIQAYWEKCDPDYVDGEGAESFADLCKRLQDFHARLRAVESDFVAVVGHGQFFRAYSLALKHKLRPNPESMRFYRQSETADPLKNGDFLSLSEEDLAQADL